MLDITILSDVDNTLRNSVGETNSDQLKPLLAELQQGNTIFGLLSDTSCDRLIDVAASFDIHSGPIIGERAQVVINGSPDTPIIFRPSLLTAVDYLKTYLPLLIDSRFKDIATIHHLTDTYEDLSHAYSLVEKGKITIACYYLRHVSLSFFFFNPAYTKNPTHDPLFIKFKQLLGWFLRQNNLQDFHVEDHEGEHYLQLIHSQAHKGSIIPWIVENYHPTRIVMIGDSMTDFLDAPDIIQCAVGNADPRYKELCQIVAKAHYTAGVYECLKRALAMISH
jgi:hydroxymethylpyrimidine pyrophosphatase-like HAD family hydrolase